MDERLDGCMAWQMDGYGWMDGQTRLTQDQTNARPDSGRLDSLTTTNTHDQKHMTRLWQDQTHAQPDSRNTRLTQDMYAIIILTNYIHLRALPY